MRTTLKTKLLAFALALGTGVSALAQTASLLPQPFQQYLDNNGNPLSGGKVFNYIPATTTPKTTWIDAAKTTANANPVILDAAGRARVYGDGTYRQILRNSANTTIWDGVTASTSGSAAPAVTVGDGLAIGTVLPYSGLTPPANWVLAAGQSLSRVTFAALLDVLAPQFTVLCQNGITTVSGFSDTSQLGAGTPLEASCLAPGTVVATFPSSTSVTVSPAATATGTVPLRAFPYGNGDGATTFQVPDLRGRAIAGRDNMGGTPALRLTATFLSGTRVGGGLSTGAAGLGNLGGGESNSLVTANLPAYTPAGTIVSTQPAHDHTLPWTQDTSSGQTGGAKFTFIAGSTTTASATPAITSTFTGTAQGGTATGFRTVQPTLVHNYIIKVTADSLESAANWQVAQFCVPLGLGVGTGFGVACPGASGQALVSTGASSNPAFGTIGVSGGGTGATTLTAFNVLIGSGTSPVTFAAPSSSLGNCLTSLGAAANPTFTTSGAHVACGPVTYAGNMVALRSLTPATTSLVWLQSYFTIGDSGEGLFYWSPASTATDNGGTIIIPDAGGTGRWLRFLPNTAELRVKWFGAKCDGVTDDAVPLQAAITAVPTTGGTLLFPPSACLTSATLSLLARNGVTLRGVPIYPGSGSSAAIHSSVTGAGKVIDGRDSNGLHIDGLQFIPTSAGFTGRVVDCGATNYPTTISVGCKVTNSVFSLGATAAGATCIYLGEAIEATVQKNNFGGFCAPAIQGQSSLGSNTVTRIIGNQFLAHIGPAIRECGEAWVVENNAFEPENTGIASWFLNTAGRRCTAMTWANNWHGDIGVSGGTGIGIETHGLDFRANQFSADGSAGSSVGISIFANSTGINITGNKFNSWGTAITCGAGASSGNRAVPDGGPNEFTGVGILINAAVNCPTLAGHMPLSGTTSGVVTIAPQAVAGTYTLQLPTALGAAFDCLKMDATALLLAFQACGAAPTAAGSDTQVQFNTAGALAASANFTWVSPRLTLGVAGSATGQLGLTGATSGTVVITAQATAGTPTLTLPNASGTFAVSATAPVALSATTGAVSITGVAGGVLAGSGPAFTATPTLGVAGTTLGTLALAGNTSGTITIAPQATAGTYNFNLPTGAGSAGQPLLSGGGGAAAQTYGTLSVGGGGSGATSLTGLLQGNGTSAFTVVTNSSTVGQVLRVTGAAAYGWGALDLADGDAVTGLLPVANLAGHPTTTTDNAAVRFDGTAGNTQNSALLIADTTGGLSRSGGGGVPLQGTNTTDSAAAGDVGEFVSATVATGSEVALADATATTITSISLTAGEWDVSAVTYFLPGTTTNITSLQTSLSLTTNTLTQTAGQWTTESLTNGGTVLGANARHSHTMPTFRVSTSSTISMFLVARPAFTVSTLGAAAVLRGRRVR